MNTVTVDASRSYEIHIGEGLMEQIGVFAAQIRSHCKVAVISDSNVWPFYGKTVISSLYQAGFDAINYVLPAGEESKNSEEYIKILNFLADNNITRGDMLIALGGGVVGDISGFAAATYLRGLPYIQVPTTLLAMVDSSVGGKTAIDLPAGKNLAGAFYQPSMVLCDFNALSTLPGEVFTDGCAEVIKYGILFDCDLFNHLMERSTAFDRAYVITRCVELKRDVVMADEYDDSVRQMLNLGHTIGHAIEKSSNFTISHGRAVSAGISIVAKMSSAAGFCSEAVPENIVKILDRFSLPIGTNQTAPQLAACALRDKKRFGGTINLILPRRIGECFIHPIPVEQLQSFIETGL